MNKLFCAVVLAGVGLLATGCSPNMEPLERTSNQIIDKVVAPAVAKAIEETSTRTATIQGGVQGIEPGWEAQVDGFLVNGFQGRFSMRAKGVAGQLTGHNQADQVQASTVDPPVNRKPPATQPAAIQKEEVPAKPVKSVKSVKSQVVCSNGRCKLKR